MPAHAPNTLAHGLVQGAAVEPRGGGPAHIPTMSAFADEAETDAEGEAALREAEEAEERGHRGIPHPPPPPPPSFPAGADQATEALGDDRPPVAEAASPAPVRSAPSSPSSSPSTSSSSSSSNSSSPSVGDVEVPAESGVPPAADPDAQGFPAGDPNVQGAPGDQALPQNRCVYSITFSHTSRRGARTPGEFTREAFAELLQKSHETVFAATVHPGVDKNKVLKVMVFCERHADGQVHLYGVVLANRPYGAEPVRQHLQSQDKVWVSFGASHAYFWTAVVYAAVPSVHKAPEEMDPSPIHSDGLTLREELADFPRGARAAEKDRVRAHLGLSPNAGRNQSGPPTLSKEDSQTKSSLPISEP